MPSSLLSKQEFTNPVVDRLKKVKLLFVHSVTCLFRLVVRVLQEANTKMPLKSKHVL